MGTYKWKPFTLLVSAEEVEKEVLRIEAGKYYKTRDGRKVGPIKSYEDRYFHKASFACREWTYLENGKWAGSLNNDNRDLISEWSEAPIRTVTRREIVEGQYGHIEISDVNNDGVSLWLPRNKRWSSEELREAAHLFNQIAEALGEDGK